MMKKSLMMLVSVLSLFLCGLVFAEEEKSKPEETPNDSTGILDENSAPPAEKSQSAEPKEDEAKPAESEALISKDSTESAEETKKKKKSKNATPWSEFLDTKINITYADDNLLENNEFSPKAGIGQRNVSEFVGETNTIRPIDINATHLVLHHLSQGYFKGLLTEAALVLKFNLATDPTSGSPLPSVGDDGSFLRLGYVFDYDTSKSMTLDIVGYPLNAESFTLGFHHDLTWGGATAFPQNKDPVPGFRIGFNHPWFYIYGGLKTHLQPKKDKLNTERVPVETVYMGLFGLGVRPYKGLAIEANGGVIDKGKNPSMSSKESKNTDILAGGLSTRVSYGYGIAIGERMDLRLYQNDPRKKLELARNDEYSPKTFSFAASGEYNFLSQNLQDPDSPSKSKSFKAHAALVSLKFKYDYFRIHLEGAYRSLEFLLFDTPGFVPFQAFPDTAKTRPELWGAISFDYHIRPAYLTLGITAGYKRPATYQGQGADPDNPDLVESPIAVVKRRTTSTAYVSPFNRPVEILPPDKKAFDIIEVKFDAEMDLSDFMTLLFELSYTLDNNRVKLEESPNNSELLIKRFEADNVTNRLGLALIFQAKF